ncbi:MAG TPA: hypothetical protein VHW23_13210, partial [Kofleriaceae bacterium]|nr:hypothetical protein [Kofleriaceae bacterium]
APVAAAPSPALFAITEVDPEIAARSDSHSITRPIRVIRELPNLAHPTRITETDLAPLGATEPDDPDAPGPAAPGPWNDSLAPSPRRRPLRPSRMLPAGEGELISGPWIDTRAATEPAEPPTAGPEPTEPDITPVETPVEAPSDAAVEPPVESARREPLPFFGTDDDPTWELEPVEPRTPVILETRYERSGPIAIAIASRAATEPDEPPAGRKISPLPIDPAPPGEPHIEIIVAVSRRNPTLTPPVPFVAAPEPLPYQLPSVDLPAGMVWPGVSGRAALAALGAPVRLVERPLSWAPRAAIELACGDGWIAHSSPELVYADLDAARPALFDAVRWQAKLTHLTPPGRTYALAPELDGIRLWVLTPTYRTVWTEIERAFATGDRATAGRLAKAGMEAVDDLRLRGVPIADLEHIAIDDPPRLLATPWTPGRDRLVAQLQRLFAAAVL